MQMSSLQNSGVVEGNTGNTVPEIFLGGTPLPQIGLGLQKMQSL